jgi:hypothetical protein
MSQEGAGKYVYFLDESGNTGDLVRMGDRLDFGGQPIFVLVGIGLQAEAGLEGEVTSPSKPWSFTDWMRSDRDACSTGEYRIGSVSFGRTFFSSSPRRVSNFSDITSPPSRINKSKM